MPPPTAILLLALIIHNFCAFVQRNVYVIQKLWHGTPACVFSHRADATPIRYCTNYAYNLSMLDETVATRPPWLDSSLPRRPCRGISVLRSTILQPLSSFAMRSHESVLAACATELHLLTPATYHGCNITPHLVILKYSK